MIVALAISLLLPATTPATASSLQSDPPIRIRLSDEVFARGDRAKVRVKTVENGYLVVLRVDSEGRIRVLFPVDPTDSATIRGGRELEIRGRGDRDAFTVDEGEGTGTVLAARSDQPFRFNDFARGEHWDYRALSADSTAGDGEVTLLDLVERMNEGRYEYDVVTYAVEGRSRARSHAGWYGPRYYDPWYHPFYPFYGPRFGFSIGIGIGGSRFRGRRWW